MSTLGALLEFRRKQLDLSMGELAKRTGLSRGYVNNLEKGRIANPSDDVLSKLASALEVPLTELLARMFVDRVGEQEMTAVEGTDKTLQAYLKERFGIQFSVQAQEERQREAWKGEYSRDRSLTSHPEGTLSILLLREERLWQVIDPQGQTSWGFPPGFVEGARSLVRVEDDTFSAFGWHAGDALFVRPVDDREQVVGRKVIALHEERHIVGIVRRDDGGEYLESPPGSAEPWRIAIEQGTEIEAEVLASIRQE